MYPTNSKYTSTDTQSFQDEYKHVIEERKHPPQNEYKPQPFTTYYPTNIDNQLFNRNSLSSSYMVNENCEPASLKYIISSSDGEGSPKSVDESETTPVNCVRGVRTITRNPGRITRQATSIPKFRGRGRKPEYTVPKEKDRARLFNEAFDCLRKRIPSIPASKKLSKIEILRLAICYMSYLKFLLEADTPRNFNTSSDQCSSSTSSEESEAPEQSQVGSSSSTSKKVVDEPPPPEESEIDMTHI